MDDDGVRARLAALVKSRGADCAALSRLLGRNPAYMQQYLKRGTPRRLREEDRAALARHFGVSESELGGPPSAPPGTDYVVVPYLGGDAGSDDPLALPTRWLGDAASARPSALAVVRMAGDSMAPTLADGDHAVVDGGDRARMRDGLYALEVDAGVVVKRVSVNPATRRLSIVSDNGAYPRFDDCDPAQIAVVGRVVWVGRQLV